MLDFVMNGVKLELLMIVIVIIEMSDDFGGLFGFVNGFELLFVNLSKFKDLNFVI